jgi:protein phosphatase
MDKGPLVQDLMPIGRFAQASRLSPKALRLYDELGLLPPSYIDEHSGYRYYVEAQLEQASSLAGCGSSRLRQLGMPLERIAYVLALSSRERCRPSRPIGVRSRRT